MATSQVNIVEQNAMARRLVLGAAVEMKQNIFAQTFNPANTNVINVIPRNVGLIKGFWVQVLASITLAGGGAGATRTDFGPANLLSQIVYTDLNNNVRHNTTGWHMNLVNTAKGHKVFGAAATTDTPTDYGNNYAPIVAPAAPATGTSFNVAMWYYIPIAYSDVNLMGAVFANVINATQNLQLTVNPNAIIASGDSTSAVYTGNAGSITSCTINVWQVYLDQLPQNPKTGQPILPVMDLSNVYMLQNTTLTGMVANTDFPIAYPNFRSFYSTSVIYNQNGTRANGTDINYWKLQSANFTNIWQISPALAAMLTREQIFDDVPTGTYYFDHRVKPIETIQYGNMELVLNPITAAAQSSAMVGWEMSAFMNQIIGAASLPAG